MSFRMKCAGLALSLSVMMGGTQALAQNEQLFTDLEQQAQTIRELDLTEPLDLKIISREDMRQQNADSLETDFPEQDTADWNQALIFLGYIEPGQNIAEIYTGLTGEQVLGYYDPTTGELVIVYTEGAEWGAIDQSTFVHETVHALQDQHYDLMATRGLDSDAEPTDDFYFARLSLIEGDSTTAETIFLVQNDLLDKYIEELSSADTGAVDDAPFFLVETLYFPYTTGAEFVMHYWTEGGWAAVDKVWENPPSTTEQIIHPEKYDAGEEAIPVAINDPLDTFGEGWRLLEYNENGELGMRVFLQNGGASPRAATQASEGWGGDADYIITNDDETAMVWSSAWDTEEDAVQYFDTLIDTEVGRLGATREDVDENTVRFTADGWVGEVHREGDVVTYYLTQSDEAMDLMIESQVDAQVPLDEDQATPEASPAAIAFWVREF